MLNLSASPTSYHGIDCFIKVSNWPKCVSERQTRMIKANVELLAKISRVNYRSATNSISKCINRGTKSSQCGKWNKTRGSDSSSVVFEMG